ncbi:MAG: BrnA antitoxin family protein [PVC group bacterium]
MKAKNTIRESRTDWNRLKDMPDSGIDFSGIPKLDKSFFESAQLRMPKRKKSVSLRLDPEVLDWFKHEGKGYQTRINAVLRAYVEAQEH